MHFERQRDVDLRTPEKPENGDRSDGFSSDGTHSINSTQWDADACLLLGQNFPYKSKVQSALDLGDNDRFSLIRIWAADTESLAADDAVDDDDDDSDDVPYGNIDGYDSDDEPFVNFLHYADFDDEADTDDSGDDADAPVLVETETEAQKLCRELKQERGRRTRLKTKYEALQ
jgi:hypothetical protein